MKRLKTILASKFLWLLLGTCLGIYYFSYNYAYYEGREKFCEGKSLPDISIKQLIARAQRGQIKMALIVPSAERVEVFTADGYFVGSALPNSAIAEASMALRSASVDTRVWPGDSSQELLPKVFGSVLKAPQRFLDPCSKFFKTFNKPLP